MPTTFGRTLRSLQADGTRRPAIELLLLGALLVGLGWAILGQVAVHETTAHARLEVRSAPHAVAAPLAGRVVENHLTLGKTVRAGEVLVRLDAEAEQRELKQAQVKHAALLARRAALGQEIAAEQEAAVVQQQGRAKAVEEARAQITGAEARCRFAREQAEVLATLRQRAAVTQLELVKGMADLETARSEVRTLQLAISRLELDRRTQESDRRVRLAKLQREAAELEGEAAVEKATCSRLENALELRTIRAPIAGTVGEVHEFRTGAVVRAADRLGAIVPPGEPHAVAFFPAAAVGRLRTGQTARLRLDAFPWAQYGTVAATVRDVGNEASAGLIRVELALTSDVASLIPRQHGLPGSAEVEVENVAPAVLVLRAAGYFLTNRPADAPRVQDVAVR